MYLGINLSHDSSAALLDQDGTILYAVAEERISRVKNHIGIPLLSIAEIFDNFDIRKLDKVFIGSHEYLTSETVNRFLSQEKSNPSNPRGRALDPFPGFTGVINNPKKELTKFLKNSSNLRACPETEVIYHNHHDSHLGCGIPLLGQESGLILSLDGEGDGESGAIAIKLRSSKMVQLARFSSLDSLGLLYAAVTKKYNFKPLHHEGKITGLAAYGKYSKMVDELMKFVAIKNGQIRLRYSKNRIMQMLGKTQYQFGIKSTRPTSIDQIIDMIQSADSNYPDLAFAVQFVVEKSIAEIVKYWIKETGVNNIALSGGVFANVKVNQKLSEMDEINNVFVFPNMGDGGIAIGSVWSWMEKCGLPISSDAASTMYVGTGQDKRFEYSPPHDLRTLHLESNHVSHAIAQDISNSMIVAVLNGAMEFGPRALGNTSILLDPRNPEIVKSVNLRLKRTEFMPFAPSVLKEHFYEYFDVGRQNLQPFYFMAMTCRVIQEKQSLIPAVTHVDGTARPQIVSKESNLYFYNILKSFKNMTGIPILVNTSFNIHEEPIIRSAETAIAALRQKAVDVLWVGNSRITL
jgi:carbamoyltransferase